MDQEETSRMFKDMGPEELDLTMFTIMDLSLSKIGKHVEMRLELKRKISMEVLTTFLPTILLLLITFTSILFDKSLFGDALAVNLTIMLVMTTIFTSKIQELPSTSDTKMIDIWLIGCLLVPFTEVVLRTMIEVQGNCDHCNGSEENKTSTSKKRINPLRDVNTMPGEPLECVAQIMVETVVSLLFKIYTYLYTQLHSIDLRQYHSNRPLMERKTPAKEPPCLRVLTEWKEFQREHAS